MASGTISLGQQGHLMGQITWSSSSNGTAANSSKVTATVQVKRDNTATTTGTWTGSLTIGGTKQDFSYYGGVSSSWVTLKSFSITKAHNANGSGTCAISATVNAPQGTSMAGYVLSASKTVTLDAIPRAASITAAPNFTDEDSPKITYSNPAGNAVSELQACISLDGSEIPVGYRDISKTGTSYTFSLTDAERKALRQATTGNSRSVRFYVRTTISGTNYTDYITKTLTIKNPAPTLSPTVEDTGAVSTVLTGDANKIIKGYNSVQITFNAAAVKEATIKSRKVTCGNMSRTSDGKMSHVESGTFEFTVTDSRGNTVTKTITKTLIEYVQLTCSLKASAPTTAGDMAFSITGNYWSGNFGAVDNTLTVQYRIKANSEEYGEWTNAAATISSGKYTAEVNPSGLDSLNTYTFQARAADKVKSGYITTAEKTVKTTPVFDWGEDDFNFNVPVDIPQSQALRGKKADGESVNLIYLNAGGNVQVGGGTMPPENIYLSTADGVGLVGVNAENVEMNAKIENSRNTLPYHHIHPTSKADIAFGVGSGGINRGIYDYKSGANKWVLYYNDENTYIADSVNSYAYAKNNVLWSGEYYMSDTQTIELSQNISKQPHGIVLIFSSYGSSSAHDYHFQSFFVPKQQIAQHGGKGHSFFMVSTPTFQKICCKYLYIHDAKIVGNADNKATGTANGITYDNSYFVLRYVIGV